MILCVALDNRNGMMFNKRRQSKDKILRKHMLSLSSNSKLWMNGYSRKQFEEADDHIFVDEEFMDKAGAFEFCFVENVSSMPYLRKIETIIIYKWNRDYPADTYFDIDLSNGWQLDSIEDFAGNSHEKITKEEWRRIK